MAQIKELTETKDELTYERTRKIAIASLQQQFKVLDVYTESSFYTPSEAAAAAKDLATAFNLLF
jgi:hypothetical protein